MLCGSHSNCWNIHNAGLQDSEKEGELAKAQLEEQKKALEEASQEASGNAQKDSASESGTDGAGTGGKAEKSGSGAGTAGTASKNAATAGNTDGSGNNGNQDGNSQTNGSQQAARTAGSASSAKLYKRQQDDLACKRHGAYELQHGQNSLLRDTRPIQV